MNKKELEKKYKRRKKDYKNLLESNTRLSNEIRTLNALIIEKEEAGLTSKEKIKRALYKKIIKLIEIQRYYDHAHEEIEQTKSIVLLLKEWRDL